MKKPSAIQHAIIATVVMCIATFGYTYRMENFGRFLSGVNDFLPRYTQAGMVGSPQMYDIEAGYQVHERIVGVHLIGGYNDRLPWQAVLMAPLSWLPYSTAYGIWIFLNLLCFAGLVHFWLLPKDFVLWGVLFVPVAASIVLGQEGIMLTFCLAAALCCAERRRDVAAGLLIALCTAKPHLFLLLPVALIAHRRWTIVKAAVAGTLGLLGIGTLAAGLDWPFRLWAVLRTLSRDSDPGHALTLIPSLFQFGMNAWTITAAVALASAVGVLIWRSRTLEAGVALAVIGGVLTAPHTSIYDLPLLLVALPVLTLSRSAGWIRILVLLPLPYWALLKGTPWNTILPALLLVLVAASSWPAFRLYRGVRSQTGALAASS